MNKYKVIITRWKSEIIEADCIDNYAAEDKIILSRKTSMGGYRDVAVFNPSNIIGVYEVETDETNN